MNDFKEYTILDAAGSASTGRVILATDFKNAIFSFATAGSATLTVKFQGSIQETAPDFSASRSASNHWDYIEVIDLQDGAAIDGDTGVAVAGTDDFRMLEANVGHLRWICATVTAFTGGTATIKVRLANND